MVCSHWPKLETDTETDKKWVVKNCAEVFILHRISKSKKTTRNLQYPSNEFLIIDWSLLEQFSRAISSYFDKHSVS